MRVAMLGPYPQVESEVVGGVEAVVVSLLKHLAELPDVELHMITCKPGLAESSVRQVALGGAGWTVHSVPREHMGRIRQHARERSLMVSILTALNPDIVHAHSTGLYAAAALDSGFPTVITVHGISEREAATLPGWRNRIRGWLNSAFERRVLRRARHLVSISPYVEKEFAHMTSAIIHTIENPVEDAYFDVQPEPSGPRILFVGRLIRRKGLHHLLAAFDTVARIQPETVLRIAGEVESESDYVAELRSYVRKRGQNVVFLGPLTMAQVAAEYGSCRLVVLPSKQETASVVIEEAMAAGRPVIASRVGGAPYMIEHEKTGLLVDYGDEQALVGSLLRLLQDDDLQRTMGQRARAVAMERFRGSAVARRTFEMYQEIIAEAACSSEIEPST